MYRWFGDLRFWEPAVRLSVLELVNSGTIDLRLASLLWLLMEYRASVLVAAGPSSAGKTTTLNMLLDFLPPEVEQVHLRGNTEDFSFLEDAKPAGTYLVASEFGFHFDYVWGDVAQRAFQLLPRGYSLGGTIHARTVKEAVYILQEGLELPLSLIAYLGAIVIMRVLPGRDYVDEPVRRVESVSLVIPENDGILLETIASRESGGNSFVFAGEGRLQAALSEKFAIGQSRVAPEMKKREQLLARLLSDGRLSSDEVREAVVDFYRSRHS